MQKWKVKLMGIVTEKILKKERPLSSVETKRRRRKDFRKRAFQHTEIYLMLIPVVAFYLIFCYYPMYGIVIAFKDYYQSKGIIGSEFVGAVHFEWLFSQPGFTEALRNTIVISLLKIALVFPFPIILSLFLNEIRWSKLKKTIQTFIYLPNFISWVVIASIVYTLLSVNGGVVNNILMSFGFERVSFLNNPKYFYPILLVSEIWKGAGWGTVIYISAISSISPDLYEAADIDGCGRLGKMFYVTLPSILPIIVIMFVLAVGNIMNAGFDPIFNLKNPSVNSVAEILDTYAYAIGIERGYVERGAALGLFKTVINFMLLLLANYTVKKMSGTGIYE